MVITLYLNPLAKVEQRTFVQQTVELCERAEPKPLFCGELSEGLKFGMDYSGTQHYNFPQYISQGTTVSGTLAGTIQLPMTYVVKP